MYDYIFVKIGTQFLDNHHYQERSAYPGIYKNALVKKVDDDVEFECVFNHDKPYEMHYGVDGEFNLNLYAYMQMNIRDHEYIVKLTSDTFISTEELKKCMRTGELSIAKCTAIDNFLRAQCGLFIITLEKGSCSMYIKNIKLVIKAKTFDDWLECYKKYRKHLSSAKIND